METNLMNNANILLAPLGGLILMIIDYLRNRSTDEVQRKIVIYMMFSALLAIVSELLYELFEGTFWNHSYQMLTLSNLFYFFFRACAFAGMALFWDYNANHSISRLKKLTVIVTIPLAANLVALMINCFNGFMFDISSGHMYVRGVYYVSQLVLVYSFLVIAACDLILSWKKLAPHDVVLFVAFALPVLAGTTIDLLVPGSRLTWPCFMLSLLFVYLFIVRSDYRVDTLTGLYNRRYCDEYLAAITKASRNRQYAFIMLDMDYFKQINDKLGHVEGDRALRDMAGILKNSTRHADFVARYGGDEFMVITDSEDVEEIVARIRRNLEDFNEKGKRPYKLEFSCGYKIFRMSETMSPEEVIARVDKMMYRDKQERRNILA